MANEQNLIPLNKRTKKEQREIATEGGIASGKARREKKTFQELAKTLLSLDVKSGKSLAVMHNITADEVANSIRFKANRLYERIKEMKPRE